MKTITFNDSSISAYIFDDEAAIEVTGTNIVCPDFVIGDLNSTNSTLYTGVTPPADWVGGRYTFSDGAWTEVEGWVDPKVAEIARLQAQIDALNA